MRDLSREKILEMLENGTISAEQAILLLNNSAAVVDESAAGAPPEMVQPMLSSASETNVTRTARAEADKLNTPELAEGSRPPGQETPPPAVEVTPDPFRGRAQAWRRWWWYPLWGGVGITLVGALLMYLAWDRSGFGFWFACTWFPFLFGVMVMALAWSSRMARWLHVRIHRPAGDGPRNISLSFPLPIRLGAWFVRTFHVHIPNMDRTSLDEVLLALEHTSPDAPFYVEVQDDDEGERVEVYIG